MKRFSQPYLNRAVLCSNTPSPPCLRLLDFIQRNRDKRSSLPKLNRATQHTDMWKQRSPTLSVPTKIDVSMICSTYLKWTGFYLNATDVCIKKNTQQFTGINFREGGKKIIKIFW